MLVRHGAVPGWAGEGTAVSMTNPPLAAGERRLRADARRNQGRILSAAREVFVERGPGAPLEEIAGRAGVGIGTLYRRFPDRRALMRAVVLDALAQTRQSAELALAEEVDSFDALTRYMHTVIDLRISAVIPLLLDKIDLDDPELRPARQASARTVEQLVARAHTDGSLPEDVSFADIGMLLVRLSRPLPGPVAPDLNDQLAHRHLDLVVEGLRPGATRRKVTSGPQISFEELRASGEGG
jgi:AcrR family transcriptional regulator